MGAKGLTSSGSKSPHQTRGTRCKGMLILKHAHASHAWPWPGRGRASLWRPATAGLGRHSTARGRASHGRYIGRQTRASLIRYRWRQLCAVVLRCALPATALHASSCVGRQFHLKQQCNCTCAQIGRRMPPGLSTIRVKRPIMSSSMKV